MILRNLALDRFLEVEREILGTWSFRLRQLDSDYRCAVARSALSSRRIFIQEERVPASILAADTVASLPGRMGADIFAFIVRWNTAAMLPRLFNPEEI